MADWFSPPLGVSSPLPLALTQGGTGLTVPAWLATSRANGASRAGLSARFKEWYCGFTGGDGAYETLFAQDGAVADTGIKGGALTLTTGATANGVARIRPVGAIKLTTNHKTERWHMHVRMKLLTNPGTNGGNQLLGWVGGSGLYNYNDTGGSSTALVFYNGSTFVATTATIAALKAAYQDIDIDFDGTTATIRVDDASVGTSASTNFGTGSYSPAIDFNGAAGGAQSASVVEIHVMTNAT